MTTEARQGRLDDGLIVLRRVRDYEILREDDGSRRPSSQAFMQNGPDGNVSVTRPLRQLRSESPRTIRVRTSPRWRSAPSETRDWTWRENPARETRGHCNITGRTTESTTRAIARGSRWTTGYAPMFSEILETEFRRDISSKESRTGESRRRDRYA